MLHLLKIGDKVEVWPRPGAKPRLEPPRLVETGKGAQLMLAREIHAGETVLWSEWLHNLAKQGALLFSDPSPRYAKAEHVRHPHEIDGDKKTAIEKGADSLAELAHWKSLGHEKAELSAKGQAAEKAKAEKAKAEKAKAEKVAAKTEEKK